MTDEEKAEEYINKNPKAKLMYCFELDRIIQIKKAYLNGLAEGRKELEQWKQEWQDAQIKANEEGFARTTLQIKCSNLEKEKIELTEVLKDKDRQLNNWYLSYNEVLTENAELKKDKEYLDKVNNEQTKVILKLNEQIEKMKCCMNCVHCEVNQEWHLFCEISDSVNNFNEIICENWKLAE